MRAEDRSKAGQVRGQMMNKSGKQIEDGKRQKSKAKWTMIFNKPKGKRNMQQFEGRRKKDETEGRI